MHRHQTLHRRTALIALSGGIHQLAICTPSCRARGADHARHAFIVNNFPSAIRIWW
ncbi:MAG: hypothetical protein ACLSTO_05180 [Bilophila wadsworthia]